MARNNLLLCIVILVACHFQGIAGKPLYFMILYKNGTAVDELTKNPGESVLLNCSVVADGRPVSIHWSKDGETLNRTHGSGAMWLPLEIRNMSENASGHYRCGGRGTGEHSNGHSVVELKVNARPRFIIGQGFSTPSPQAFYIGETPLFHCYAVGRPKPTIQWFLNDKLLADGDMFYSIIISKKTNGLDLKILIIEKMHSGVLRCQASNSLGLIAHNITLTVKSFSEEPLSLKVSRHVKKRSQVLLVCVTSTVPLWQTDVFWKFENGSMPVNSNKYRIVRTTEDIHGSSGVIRSVLKIHRVSTQDVGTYTCTVAYPLGIKETSVKLGVEAVEGRLL